MGKKNDKTELDKSLEEIFNEIETKEEIDDDEKDDDDLEIFSTVPLSTFDKKNRLNYVALMQDYHSDDENKKKKAIEAIIGDLTGLVLYIIKRKYSSYTTKYYDDLVQSGELGILIGLKDYDPTKSMPSTYFHCFIIHEIQDFINQNVHKTTSYYSAHIRKINKVMSKLETLGLPCTSRDISIQTGLPLDTVEKVLRIMHGSNEVGLDTCENTFENPDFGNPATEYIKKESAEDIRRILQEVLTEEEAQILFYLHGIGDNKQLSLKVIAQKMSISIDRVKKLKTLAYCKLRNSPLAQYKTNNYKNELMEIEDEGSVSFFPHEQALRSMKEMEEIEIEF